MERKLNEIPLGHNLGLEMLRPLVQLPFFWMFPIARFSQKKNLEIASSLTSKIMIH